MRCGNFHGGREFDLESRQEWNKYEQQREREWEWERELVHGNGREWERKTRSRTPLIASLCQLSTTR